MNRKPILAYDCATVGASLALQAGRSTLTRHIEQTRQAAELVPAMQALLAEQNITYEALQCIVTTTGPGSFTGVRIGLAALHGLVLVTGTPVKLLTTLAAMAWQVTTRTEVPPLFYILLRAGKGELYVQKFSYRAPHPVPMGEIFLAPETTQAWDAPCFGNVADTSSLAYFQGPDAATLCAIAPYLPTTPLAEAVPTYIRPPDAIAPAPLAWLTD